MLIALDMFKCLRSFGPSFVADAHPACEDIEELCHKCELPTYTAEAVDISSQLDKTDWGKRNADKLPKWANACKKVLLPQPSCFSVLSNSFSNNNSLRETTIHTFVMIQYNNSRCS